MLVLALVGVGSVAIELALGLALLFARSGPVHAGRALRAAWLVAILAGAKALALLVLLDPSLFLLVHLGWLSAVVVLPLLGAATLLAARRREVTAPVRALALAARALAPVGGWGSFVEPRRLEVETVHVPVDARRALPQPLRVGVLADLQARRVGAHERRAVDGLLALAPDLILLPGDVAQIWPRTPDEAREEFRALLARLEAPLGVFVVRGNSDDRRFLDSILEGTSVRLLDDETVHLERDGLRIALCGLDLDHRALSSGAALDGLVRESGVDELRLVVTHLPDAVHVLPQEGVDLLIAGHTHGGQVVVPGFGPPLTLTSVPRDVAAGGLSVLDGQRVYVSRGVGMERGWAPPLRLFCPPELTLLVFERDRPER